MRITDAQLHLDDEHSAEVLLEMMASVGVDAAVLTQSGKQTTPAEILRAAEALPDRFAMVAVFRPDAPDLEDTLASWSEQANAVGIRVVLRTEEERARFDAGEFAPLLAAAQRLELPFLTFPHAQFERWGQTAADYPQLQIVIDHFGQPQPPHVELGPDPWVHLPGLLALAEHGNIAVKFTRAPCLSLEPFPFTDVWPRLHAVADAFGLDRLMWGSDITEVHGLHTYDEAVRFLVETDELSSSEKERLMGGTLRKLLRWPRAD